MKTKAQIKRFLSRAEFSDRDWGMVLDWCRTRYGGGTAHRATRQARRCTFDEFLEWALTGLAGGEAVRYGNTVGIAGPCLPGHAVLAAYRDLDGRMIVKDMEVADMGRLEVLPAEAGEELHRQLYDMGLYYDDEVGMIAKLHKPHEGECVTVRGGGTGIYMGSVYRTFRFAAYRDGGGLKFDCSLTLEPGDVKRSGGQAATALHRAIKQAGYVYNPRLGRCVKAVARKPGRTYWYVNDRLDVVADVDDGKPRHGTRFDKGNYFTSRAAADRFCREVRALAAEEKGMSGQ